MHLRLSVNLSTSLDRCQTAYPPAGAHGRCVVSGLGPRLRPALTFAVRFDAGFDPVIQNP